MRACAAPDVTNPGTEHSVLAFGCTECCESGPMPHTPNEPWKRYIHNSNTPSTMSNVCSTVEELDERCVEFEKCGEGDSFLIERYLPKAKGDQVLAEIDSSITYLSRDDPRMQFRIYGKEVKLPRDKAVLGEIEIDEEKKERIEPFYRYAKDTPPVEDWKGTVLKEIQGYITEDMDQSCNHVVVNQYRDGKDYIGYHHDKSKTFELGSSVLTLSLGASRILRLRKVRGEGKGAIKNIKLNHGSLFVLGPETNRNWKHSIVQKKGLEGRRVSLTYRSIAARRISPFVKFV